MTERILTISSKIVALAIVTTVTMLWLNALHDADMGGTKRAILEGFILVWYCVMSYITNMMINCLQPDAENKNG